MLSSLQPKENGAKKDGNGGVAIRMPYLRVVDIQDDSESDSFTATFTYVRFDLGISPCVLNQRAVSKVSHVKPT